MRLQKHLLLLIFTAFFTLLSACSEIEQTETADTDTDAEVDPNTGDTTSSTSIKLVLLDCSAAGDVTLAQMPTQCTVANEFDSNKPATLHATVSDSDGALSNTIVTFSSTLGSIPGESNGLTDANGMAIQTITFETSTNGAGSVSAESDGTSVSANYTVSPTGGQGATLKVELYDCTAQPSGISNIQIVENCLPTKELSANKPGILLSTLTDSNAQAMEGEIIQFTASAGDIPQLANGLTDAQGMTSQTISVAADINGAAVITASGLSIDVSDAINFAIKAVNIITPDEMTFLLLNCNEQSDITPSEMPTKCPELNEFSSNIPATLHVTVRNSSGAPIENDIISFTSTIGTIPGSSNALSDANGIAVQSISFAPESDGAATVTAQSQALSASSSINYSVLPTKQPTNSATIDIRLYDCTAQPSDLTNSQIVSDCTPAKEISSIQPGVIVSTLTDPNGKALADQIIEFDATAGDIPELGNGLTDENGMASQAITAASNISGAATVSASSLGVNDEVNFAIKAVTVDASNANIQLNLYDCNDHSSVALADIPTTCTESSNVSFSRPLTILAQLTDGKLSPVANEIISFSSTTGTIPGQQNGLTDANGQTSQLLTVSTEDSGAGTITASALQIDSNKNFSIGATNLTMVIESGIAEGSSLGIGSSTPITVSIKDDANNFINVPFTVEMTSRCVEEEKAELDSTVVSLSSNVDGKDISLAKATYQSLNCKDEDTITVTTNLANLNGTYKISIDNAPANSIKFVSAEPEEITIQGTGDSESSVLTFQVLDGLNKPVAQKEVFFELASKTPGVATVQTSAVSNADGEVMATITSGHTPAVVQVKASFPHPEAEDNSSPHFGQEISTLSNSLVISTGFADNDGLSISFEMRNPEGWSIDGEEVKVTARLNDHKNNPVPDGTAVNFETEGGRIEPSCLTVKGTCSVQWNSQNPRSSDGRITVLAYAVGEEYFSDVQPSDGVFIPGDDPVSSDYWPAYLPYPNRHVENDIAEAFRDDNENNVFDTMEEFTDANNNGTWDTEVFVDWNRNGKHDEMEPLTNDQNGNGRYDKAERYVDLNGNGIWNDAEELTNDVNGNGSYDDGDTFTDANGNGSWDARDPLHDVNGNGIWDDEDGYTDVNANGRHDIAEPLLDLDGDGSHSYEAFVDANGNNRFDFSEEYHDFDSNGSRTPANGIFNGTLCETQAALAGSCTKDTVYIYRNETMTMSTSAATIRLFYKDTDAEIFSSDVIDISIGAVNLYAVISDQNGNSMPGTSSYTVSVKQSELLGNTSGEIPTNVTNPHTLYFLLKRGEEPEGVDYLNIKVSSPSGVETNLSINVKDL